MSVDRLSRAYALYRRTAMTRSSLALLAANAVPLAGVLFLGWGLWTILVIYWLENGIVGFWNLPRIALAQGTPAPAGSAAAGAAAARPSVSGRPAAGGRFALAVFFVIHYGTFWLGHGLFVFLLPSIGAAGPCGALPAGGAEPAFPPLPIADACGNGAFGTLDWGSIALAAGVLFLSHGASFLLNYVGRGEYLRASAMRQLMAPYGRVVVLHLTIIFGGFVVGILGAPIGLVVVLVVLKTLFDLGLHAREHDRTDAWRPA